MAPWSILLCLRSAHAGAPAYYHPDDVAAKSARFAEVAQSAAPAFDQAQGQLTRLGDALKDLEIGVALLGDAAPDALRTWANQTAKVGMAGFLTVQRYSDEVQDGYSSVFQAAMDRALPKVEAGKTLVVCQKKRVMGPGMATASCTGEDLNGAIAAAMDADPTLRQDLAKISASAWPTVALSPQAQAAVPLTGDKVWISAARVADALMKARLGTRAEALEDAQAPLEEGLESQDGSALAQAEALKAAYMAGLGDDGAVLRAAVVKALARAKRDVPGEIGLCANPVALGGCAGEDVTASVLPVLQADRKLSKDLQRKLAPLP